MSIYAKIRLIVKLNIIHKLFVMAQMTANRNHGFGPRILLNLPLGIWGPVYIFSDAYTVVAKIIRTPEPTQSLWDYQCPSSFAEIRLKISFVCHELSWLFSIGSYVYVDTKFI